MAASFLPQQYCMSLSQAFPGCGVCVYLCLCVCRRANTEKRGIPGLIPRSQSKEVLGFPRGQQEWEQQGTGLPPEVVNYLSLSEGGPS